MLGCAARSTIAGRATVMRGATAFAAMLGNAIVLGTTVATAARAFTDVGIAEVAATKFAWA